jgi:serine/threonine-protein kinase
MRKLFCAGALFALLATSACGGAPEKIDGMSYVGPGKFKMGYDKGRENEKPLRETECDRGFYIGVTEVTNEQYAAFLAATKRAAPPTWKDGKVPEGQGKCPVSSVSYLDASAYCDWKGGYRLPTEVEWEYAARGTDGRLYPWGNDFSPTKCNTFTSGKNGPVDVGWFKDGKGPNGTLDQAGNVWEWTSSDGPAANQKWIKGGSYGPNEDPPRASLRTPVDKGTTAPTIGFRVAKDG